MDGRYLSIHANLFSGCQASSDFLYRPLVHFLLLPLNKLNKQTLTVLQSFQDRFKLLQTELGKMDVQTSRAMTHRVCVCVCCDLRFFSSKKKFPIVLARGQWIILLPPLGRLAPSPIVISLSIRDRWLFVSSSWRACDLFNRH